MGASLRVLVVDDIAANCKLICRFVESIGHRTIEARNGLEAVEACREAMPDLVLLDIMMPVMDGIRAAAEIRKLSGSRWVPIIFLTAKNTEADQIEVLEVGDDFMSKPINLGLLEAKIKVFSRIAEIQQRLVENSASLQAYREESEREQQFAGHLLEQIIEYKENATGLVRRWLQPARHFSGDVIVHALTPDCRLHCLIADSTGHGLAAAICTLPLIDTFFSMTEKGFMIDEIAREINAKLNHLLPTGRFVAAALASVDESEVKIWNGGIPFAVFLSHSGKILREWASQYPPLGMLPDSLFDAKAETWQWTEPGTVFISSDGIVESENEQGEFFGVERFKALLCQANGQSVFDEVVAATKLYLGKAETRDDLSLVAIACG